MEKSVITLLASVNTVESTMTEEWNYYFEIDENGRKYEMWTREADGKYHYRLNNPYPKMSKEERFVLAHEFHKRNLAKYPTIYD